MTSEQPSDARARLAEIVERMRSQGPRYKSHDLGFVDSVGVNTVEDWADDIEAVADLLARPVPVEPQGDRPDRFPHVAPEGHSVLAHKYNDPKECLMCVATEIERLDSEVYRNLAERAQWYRDGCEHLEDRDHYFASGDCARDAASDLETALSEIRVLQSVIRRFREGGVRG